MSLDSVKLNSLGYLTQVDGDLETGKRIDAGGGKVTEPVVETQKRDPLVKIPELAPKKASSIDSANFMKNTFAPVHNLGCPVAKADYGPEDNVALNLELNA
ncbi:hypothetical protein J6S88_04605 [bacterium]|nr:hypothetical protein [bacterium]